MENSDQIQRDQQLDENVSPKFNSFTELSMIQTADDNGPNPSMPNVINAPLSDISSSEQGTYPGYRPLAASSSGIKGS